MKEFKGKQEYLACKSGVPINLPKSDLFFDLVVDKDSVLTKINGMYKVRKGGIRNKNQDIGKKRKRVN